MASGPDGERSGCRAVRMASGPDAERSGWRRFSSRLPWPGPGRKGFPHLGSRHAGASLARRGAATANRACRISPAESSEAVPLSTARASDGPRHTACAARGPRAKRAVDGTPRGGGGRRRHTASPPNPSRAVPPRPRSAVPERGRAGQPPRTCRGAATARGQADPMAAKRVRAAAAPRPDLGPPHHPPCAMAGAAREPDGRRDRSPVAGRP